MKINFLKTLTITLAVLLFSTVGFSQEAADTSFDGIEDTKKFSSADLIYMDRDLSTFASLVTLSGLLPSLVLTDETHTLFVPNNEAFASMTIEDFAKLTAPTNRANLTKFVNRHFVPTKIMSGELTEQSVITQGNNEEIKITKDADNVWVGGASIAKADIETSNGVIHVLNEVIDPVN